MITINDLQRAAILASAAYDDTPDIKNMDIPEGYLVEPFRVGNHQGLLVKDRLTLHIAFAGTNDPKDWLFNLDTRQRVTASGNVHTGFAEAVDMVWSHIAPWITRTLHVRCTGHSMGGAMAVIAARRIRESSPGTDVRVVTFGQPRCGDAQWAASDPFRYNYVRVFNAGDPVPHAPSFIRFRHAGLPLFFTHDGKPTESTPWNRTVAAVNALLLQRESKLAMLHAHSMDTYKENILSLASLWRDSFQKSLKTP